MANSITKILKAESKVLLEVRFCFLAWYSVKLKFTGCY